MKYIESIRKDIEFIDIDPNYAALCMKFLIVMQQPEKKFFCLKEFASNLKKLIQAKAVAIIWCGSGGNEPELKFTKGMDEQEITGLIENKEVRDKIKKISEPDSKPFFFINHTDCKSTVLFKNLSALKIPRAFDKSFGGGFGMICFMNRRIREDPSQSNHVTDLEPLSVILDTWVAGMVHSRRILKWGVKKADEPRDDKKAGEARSDEKADSHSEAISAVKNNVSYLKRMLTLKDIVNVANTLCKHGNVVPTEFFSEIFEKDFEECHFCSPPRWPPCHNNCSGKDNNLAAQKDLAKELIFWSAFRDIRRGEVHNLRENLQEKI